MSSQPSAQTSSQPSAPVLPRDRLGKVARTTRVSLYLDETAVDAHLRAQAELEAEQRRLDITRAARIAQAKARARHQHGEEGASMGVEEAVERAEANVLVEDTETLVPLQAAASLAERQAKAAEIPFVFRSVGRSRWRAAIEACPPGEEDREEWKRQGLEGEPQYDSEALLRWSLGKGNALVSPQLSAEEVEDLLAGESWNDQEVALLWATCLEAQTTARSKR